MNLPNKLTLLRCALVPLIILCFYLPFSWSMWAGMVLFVAAAVTDVVDGRYARAHNLVTDFGKFMDPIADKLVVNSVLIMLSAFGKVHPVITVLFIAREFAVSGLRLVAANKGVVLAAGKLGKLKTTFQCIAIPFLMLDNPIFRLIHIPFDQIMLWASLILSLWSGADYIIRNKELIKQA